MAEQLIGNYRVLKQIGAGGMAKVYLAVHKDIPNLKVILKILSDPRLVQRFKQEADKLALLDGNPNICRIKHFFTHGEDVVIAMEYIDGQTLDDRLKAEKRMAIGEAVRIIREALDILQFAHERGVYHRDIKPSNIMIDQSGTVKIIDFGIAKGESDPNLTIAGTACGTPAFMAPEQFTPSDDTNYALVDVYGAGITLYRMLTGQLPFEGDNEFAIRDAKLFTDPANPRSLAPGITRELEACILQSIAKNPEQRYQSAGEMRQALRSIDSDRDAEPQQPTVDFRSQPVRPKRRLSIMPVGLAAAAVVVVAIVAWFIWSAGGPAVPAVVTLLSPADRGLLTESASPTLTWSEAEAASYILEYAPDSLFADSRTVAGLTAASFAFSSALPNGTYYWRVYSVNSDGERSGASDWRSFGVEMPPLRGRIEVEVEPRGDIYIDGVRRARGESRLEAPVDTGQHIIRVENRASRQKIFQDTVHIAPDESVTQSYRFTFLPTPDPVVVTGKVVVGSRPGGATVYIDGELQPGSTPYTYPLTPGRHIIRATLLVEGGQVERADTLRVFADSIHTLMFNFE